MANQLFYFGTAERMAWVPCPNTGMTANNVGWRASGQLLNGGAFERSSLSSHKEYNMGWPMMSHEDAYALVDYFTGVYGSGPFYFLDPMAMAYNVLPSYLGAPRLQADSPFMVTSQAPVIGAVSTASNGYPTRTAAYTMAVNQVGNSYTFPVPPGYTFRFGWHGSVTGTARVRISGATTADTSPISSTGSTVRVNTTVAPDSASNMVTVSLIGGASGGTLTLRGMTAVVLPTATPNPSGDFASGRGNSGVKLASEPQITAYSAAINGANVGVTANFVETGAWE